MDKELNSKGHSSKAKNEVQFSTLCYLAQLGHEIIGNQSKLVGSTDHPQHHFSSTYEIMSRANKGIEVPFLQLTVNLDRRNKKSLEMTYK